ncbi:MAG: site-2 protease family protein [Planctomycetota bacterium]
MFIEYLAKDPHFYVYVVVTMVFSIVLHELAHGWAALWQGDRTPQRTGHMTVDPRVHMGTTSLLMVLLLGIGFGAMPVDPTRFRGKHGDLLVSLAGPLMNLLLAFVALTGLGAWMLLADDTVPASVERGNLQMFLFVFGFANLALAVFNLVPIPPLDGSTVLAGLSKGYRRWIEQVQNPMVFLVAFLAVWALFSSRDYNLYGIARNWAEHYLQFLFGLFGR